MTRWRKWRGGRIDLVGAAVKVLCGCGDWFWLRWPDEPTAHCLGCDMEFKLMIQVVSRDSAD